MSPQQIRARQLLDLGRHAEAEAALREPLTEDMDNYFTWLLLTRALEGQNKLSQAEDSARRAIMLEPEIDSGHFLLARVLLARSKSREALKAIEEAIRFNPEDSDNYSMLARIHWEAGRYQPTLEAARTGLQFDPDNEGCRFYLGLAQSRLGEREAADSALRGLLADDPEDAENHTARGFHLLDCRDHEGAKRHFIEALRLDSSHAGARDGLTVALKARNPVFARILSFELLTTRWGLKGVIALIGLLILATELLKRGRDIPWVSPVCVTLLVVIWVGIMLSVSSAPIFTLLLLRDREGRHAVSRQDKAGALWCLPLLALTLWAVVRWFMRDPSSFPTQAFLLLSLTHPVWQTFQSGSAWVRKRMALLAILCVAFAGGIWIAVEWKASPVRAAISEAVPGANKLTKSERLERLKGVIPKEEMADLERTIKTSMFLQLALLLVCLHADNIRNVLERRAPDPH